MFTVRWMRDDSNEPIATESFYLTSLDRIVCHCKADLLDNVRRHALDMPDGFIVCRDGQEVRRWFGPSHGESTLSAPSPDAEGNAPSRAVN
jgi:hypothetical protein